MGYHCQAAEPGAKAEKSRKNAHSEKICGSMSIFRADLPDARSPAPRERVREPGALLSPAGARTRPPGGFAFQAKTPAGLPGLEPEPRNVACATKGLGAPAGVVDWRRENPDTQG